MATKTKTQLEEENKQQVATFRKAVRELGCEDNEERFKQALRTVAKAKPQPQSQPKKQQRP
jgi:hypothetical protein